MYPHIQFLSGDFIISSFTQTYTTDNRQQGTLNNTFKQDEQLKTYFVHGHISVPKLWSTQSVFSRYLQKPLIMKLNFTSFLVSNTMSFRGTALVVNWHFHQ
jgi:hypothetical protein